MLVLLPGGANIVRPTTARTRASMTSDIRNDAPFASDVRLQGKAAGRSMAICAVYHRAHSWVLSGRKATHANKKCDRHIDASTCVLPSVEAPKGLGRGSAFCANTAAATSVAAADLQTTQTDTVSATVVPFERKRDKSTHTHAQQMECAVGQRQRTPQPRAAGGG